MVNIRIAVTNASTVLTDKQVQQALPALQTQIHRDFAPVWGIDADLTFVPSDTKPPKGYWWVVVLDDSDEAGALGYHDLTDEGLPLGKVFAGTDKLLGLSWTVTASHEILEMLDDPNINLMAYVQNGMEILLFSYEVCDPCEKDELGYKINGTMVSDFVYPAWFESFWKKDETQFDFRKKIHNPFDILPGGYIGVFDVSYGNGWYQSSPDKKFLKYEERPRVGSRRERRRTPRKEWIKSGLKMSMIKKMKKSA